MRQYFECKQNKGIPKMEIKRIVAIGISNLESIDKSKFKRVSPQTR